MELWTSAHGITLIPTTILMLLFSLILRHFLIKKELKYRMIPFQILAVILFIIEIGKQIDSFSDGHYDLYHLPFHFCSLFIFMLPLSAFYKGKHREAVFSVTAAICSSVFLLMMIYPNLIYSAYNVENYFSEYQSFHTVTFHNIVILEFFMIIALKLNEPKPRRDLLPVILFMVGFSLVAAVMAQVLKTNYANMYTCNIPPLESVRLAVQNACGYVPAQILYVTIVSILQIAFTVMAYYFYLLFKIKKEKSE